MTYKSVARADGSLSLGPDAWAAGFKPGTVVEVIVTRAGSLILSIDDSPPPVDLAFKLLTGGAAQLALRTGRRK